MTKFTALYFHEGDYLGYENLDSREGNSSSRAFLCETCGKVYGYRIVTTLGKKNPYASWGGLCKNCSPVGDEAWSGLYHHVISGGFPFFLHYKNPPLDAIKHQLEMELLTYARRNQTIPTLHLTRSECPTNGTVWDGKDSLHRHIG